MCKTISVPSLLHGECQLQSVIIQVNLGLASGVKLSFKTFAKSPFTVKIAQLSKNFRKASAGEGIFVQIT